ncbi:MAG: hypothetical protein GXO63_02230 [Candidatus Micrarchaeota archaeon]|nr:hypothetical protein [Candidatus Micrarchaeota archaeon]
MLTAPDKDEKALKIYEALERKELDTPEEIVKRKEEFKEAIRKTLFPGRKAERILKAAEYWLSSDLPEKILRNSSPDRELRDEIAKNVPGVGPKTASFYLNKLGYPCVVTIDLWVLRYLKTNGYNVPVPDYEKNRGLPLGIYRELEELLGREAEKHSLPPAVYTFAIWSALRLHRNSI